MTRNNQIKTQEQEAIKYTKDLIKHRKRVESGEVIEMESFWQEAFLSLLKQQALVYVGEALKTLKKEGIKWATDLAKWLLKKLEDYLVSCYEKASEEEKELFLAKIKENFPNSNLVKKLEIK